MKRCSKCSEEKEVEMFSIDKSTKDGRKGWCRRCVSLNRSTIQRGGRSKAEVSRDLSLGTKVCSSCNRRLSFDSFTSQAKSPDLRGSWCKDCAADRRIEANLVGIYGITLGEYNLMLKSQGGKCKICGRTEQSSGRRFSVDHNHTTGKVRGILCNNCNTGIGSLQDSPKLMYKAIDYLKEKGHYGD